MYKLICSLWTPLNLLLECYCVKRKKLIRYEKPELYKKQLYGNNIVCGFAACLHDQMSYVAFQCSQFPVFDCNETNEHFLKTKKYVLPYRKKKVSHYILICPNKSHLSRMVPYHGTYNWWKRYFREVQL